jgi:RNA polymerase sigma-70 factor (sigma-E family)
VDFEDQFDALAAVAYRVAHRLLGEREDAEDVAQEALARAYARWPSVAGHAEAWVARVATNLAIGRYRTRRRGAADVGPPAREGHGAGVADALVVDRLGLVDALRRLPRRQREVLVLRYLADLTEQDVADALGTSVGTVKQHAHRATTRLRVELATYGGA